MEDIEKVRRNISSVNPTAQIIDAASPIRIENPDIIRGKKVLVIEDGPTVTHGDMKYGAGIVAAKRYGAHVIDPRPYLCGSLVATFQQYPGIGTLLPAMGYGEKQIKDLQQTINTTDCDAVIIATPIDLRRIVEVNKSSARVLYELQEIGRPNLEDALADL